MADSRVTLSKESGFSRDTAIFPILVLDER